MKGHDFLCWREEMQRVWNADEADCFDLRGFDL